MLDTGDIAADPLDGIDAAIGRAADALRRGQKADGHWVFELEADATIPSEYILLRHYLGEPDDLALEAAIGRYLRRIQGSHGGWALYHDGAFDISATVKAYYALKIIGDDIDAPHMARARAEILKRGGAGASNVFTRIQLALFGAGKWSVVPEMPVELMLAPKGFPINLYRMSYWARTVIVPLLALAALRPVARNPRGVTVDELYAPGRHVLKRGGAAAANVFTRIQLALFGAGKWSGVPEVPVELMLAPQWFPINLYRMSYWARTVIVPLIVLTALRPVARNPRKVKVDELFVPGNPPLKRALPGKWQWEMGFGALDVVLKRGRGLWPKSLRQKAIDACVTLSPERHAWSLRNNQGYCRQRTTRELLDEISRLGEGKA